MFLKKLALGVSSGVIFQSSESRHRMQYTLEELWYAKHAGKWGLTIRIRSGQEGGDEEEIESWPFNEAPRALRVQAIRAIPDLLEKLVRDAESMAKDVDEKAGELSALTDALTESARSGGTPRNSLFGAKLAAVLEPPKSPDPRQSSGNVLKASLEIDRGQKL